MSGRTNSEGLPERPDLLKDDVPLVQDVPQCSPRLGPDAMQATVHIGRHALFTAIESLYATRAGSDPADD